MGQIVLYLLASNSNYCKRNFFLFPVGLCHEIQSSLAWWKDQLFCSSRFLSQHWFNLACKCYWPRGNELAYCQVLRKNLRGCYFHGQTTNDIVSVILENTPSRQTHGHTKVHAHMPINTFHRQALCLDSYFPSVNIKGFLKGQLIRNLKLKTVFQKKTCETIAQSNFLNRMSATISNDLLSFI